MPDTVQAGTTMYPFLRYHDAVAAIGWLSRAFGLEPRAVHAGPDNTVAHAELASGGSILMLGSTKDDQLGLKTAREVGAATQGIYMCVADIDAHYARVLAGNLWSFGTGRPGAA